MKLKQLNREKLLMAFDATSLYPVNGRRCLS